MTSLALYEPTAKPTASNSASASRPHFNASAWCPCAAAILPTPYLPLAMKIGSPARVQASIWRCRQAYASLKCFAWSSASATSTRARHSALGSSPLDSPRRSGCSARSDREARRLELATPFSAPRHRLVVLCLPRSQHADVIFAVANEERIAGPRSGFDLAMPPGLRLAEVLRVVLGQRHVAQGQAQRPGIVTPGLDQAQRLQRQFAGPVGLADQRMQVAGGAEQFGRLLRRLMQVRQAFIEPGERQRPILEIGGNAGCRGVHAHAERHRQVLLQQLGQAFQRRGLVTGERAVAQVAAVDAVPLLQRTGGAHRGPPTASY